MAEVSLNTFVHGLREKFAHGVIEPPTGVDDDPFQLESILTQQSDLKAVTPADLQAAAKRFLVPGTAYRIKVVKGPAANASAATGKD